MSQAARSVRETIRAAIRGIVRNPPSPPYRSRAVHLTATPGAGKTTECLAELFVASRTWDLRSVYLASSSYADIRRNVDFTSSLLQRRGYGAEAGCSFAVIRTQSRRSPGELDRAKKAAVLIAHDHHLGDSGLWDLGSELQEGGELLHDRAILVLDDIPAERLWHHWRIPKARIRKIASQLGRRASRADEYQAIKQRLAPVDQIDVRHDFGVLRMAIDSAQRRTEALSLAPGELASLARRPQYHRHLLFELIRRLSGSVDNIDRDLADLLVALLRGETVIKDDQPPNPVAFRARANLKWFRERLRCPFLLFFLDATGDPHDFERPDADGWSHLNAPQSLLESCERVVPFHIVDSRAVKARVTLIDGEKIKGEKLKSHTLGNIKRVGRTLRQRLSRGLEAYMRLLHVREDRPRLGILTSEHLLERLYGVPTDESDVDVRKIMARSLRMAIGAHPLEEGVGLEIDYCGAIRPTFRTLRTSF